MADLVDAEPRGEVVDAREHQIDWPARERTVRHAAHQVLKVLHGGDVVVVVLDLDVGVDEGERLLGSLNLAHATLVGRVEESVHVGQLHLVVVKDEQLAHAAPHQHLGRNRSDAADADHDDRHVADLVIVLHHACAQVGRGTSRCIIVCGLWWKRKRMAMGQPHERRRRLSRRRSSPPIFLSAIRRE